MNKTYNIDKIEGGVCAAKGFVASGVHCGIRKNKSKRDLALIYTEKKASAACVYTQNLVKGAPIYVTKENVSDGYAHAVICNSGNANTCNKNGIEIAKGMCDALADEMNISANDIVVASTGVIGQPLDLAPIKSGIPSLVAGLSADGSKNAAEGIMTTDTKLKEISFKFDIGGVECHIGGIAKGSGMIHPNMATMLVFITSDVAITPAMLRKALSEDIKHSFNMISVDGDTSTNDMVSVLANGVANNPEINSEGEEYDVFCAALSATTTYLCRSIAADGEGATKLLECIVEGGVDYDSTAKVAKSVICSSLVKAAMFGSDANWGRVLCAIGYSGVDVDTDKIDVSFKSKAGSVEVCHDGRGIDFSEEIAKVVLTEDEIQICVNLNVGDTTAIAWGCDLTYDYVKINGDYRT